MRRAPSSIRGLAAAWRLLGSKPTREGPQSGEEATVHALGHERLHPPPAATQRTCLRGRRRRSPTRPSADPLLAPQGVNGCHHRLPYPPMEALVLQLISSGEWHLKEDHPWERRRSVVCEDSHSGRTVVSVILPGDGVARPASAVAGRGCLPDLLPGLVAIHLTIAPLPRVYPRSLISDSISLRSARIRQRRPSVLKIRSVVLAILGEPPLFLSVTPLSRRAAFHCATPRPFSSATDWPIASAR